MITLLLTFDQKLDNYTAKHQAGATTQGTAILLTSPTEGRPAGHLSF